MKKINSSKMNVLQEVIDSINIVNSSIDESEFLKGNEKLRLCLYTKAGIFVGKPRTFSEEEISKAKLITFNEDKTQFHINFAHIIKNTKDSLKDNVSDTCIIENDVICLTNVEFINNANKTTCPEILIFVDDVVACFPCFE